MTGTSIRHKGCAMNFPLSFLNIGSSIVVKPTSGGGGFVSRTPAIEDSRRQDLIIARRNLLKVFDALESLAGEFDAISRLSLDLPDAESTAALGLDLTSTAASLSSVGEINASQYSFSPFGPDWDDGSSALLTIGGEYDGSDGAGNISFEVRRPGTKGVDNLRIRVRDPQGSIISNINIRANHDPDREYSLQNGLFLTLGAGSLIDRDTSATQVFDNVGAAFDPALPLGGVRNQNPNFQYYPAPNTLSDVVDGSFLLNGESISVSAAESLNDVLDRINQSAAGVTASFNTLTERVELEQSTEGSVPTIALSGDNSNLLTSAKLDLAVTVPGIDPETRQVIANVAAFSSVQSGNILVNGTQIAIDVANDSLEDVLARIDTSPAGVSAVFDAGTSRVRIQSEDPNNALELDSNGTAFFGALRIPEGRVDPVIDGEGVSRRRSYEIADRFEAAFAALNELFRDGAFRDAARNASAFRGGLVGAVSELFAAAGDEQGHAFGLTFDRSDAATRYGRFAAVDRQRFTRDLQFRGGDVKRLLVGNAETAGLIGQLAAATEAALRDIDGQIGHAGSIVNTYV